MLLKDFLKVFICFGDNEIVINDKRDGKSYYDLYPPKGLMNRKVIAFYVDKNKIVVRIN